MKDLHRSAVEGSQAIPMNPLVPPDLLHPPFRWGGVVAHGFALPGGTSCPVRRNPLESDS